MSKAANFVKTVAREAVVMTACILVSRMVSKAIRSVIGGEK